jgi:hypothetical protein
MCEHVPIVFLHRTVPNVLLAAFLLISFVFIFLIVEENCKRPFCVV